MAEPPELPGFVPVRRATPAYETRGFMQGLKNPPKSTQRTRELLSGLEPVREEPTVSGYAREAAKEVAREVPKSAVASPLKGLGALQYANKLKSNETLLYPMIKTAADKLRDPKTRDEAIKELEGYRNSWIYGLDKDQKAALDTAITRAKDGESDPSKLLRPLEAVKPTPIEQRSAYKAGAKIEKVLNEAFVRTKGYEDSVGLDVAGAIGSTVGSVAQGLVLGTPGLVAASALQGIDEQLGRAKQAGLKDEEAAKFAVAGAGPGAAGMLSIEFILRKIPPIARKKLLTVAGDVAASGAAEAVTEAVQQMMQNRIEQRYNPDRGLFDGTIYAGAFGGAAGAGVRGAIILAMGGKGGRGAGGGPENIQAELEAAQKELAAKEVQAREKEKADGATGAKAKHLPKTPAEAAIKGETKVEGEPVTITWGYGDVIKGIVQARSDDGGFAVVDQEGVVHDITAEHLQPDPKTGKPLVTKQDGWLRVDTDYDIEKRINEYLARDEPWRKVTIETAEGKLFKGAEGPQDASGGSTVVDGGGTLHTFPPGAVEIREGWEPGAPSTPDPIIGERAKEKSLATNVTASDADSPLDTKLVRDGRATAADVVGSTKANALLREAGLPQVETFISFQDDDGKTVTGTVHDATAGHVEILTSDDELIAKPFEEAKPRITPLPSFLRNLERLPEQRGADDGTQGRVEGQAGVEDRQGAGDTQQQEGSLRAGVGDQEGQGTQKEVGQVREAERQVKETAPKELAGTTTGDSKRKQEEAKEAEAVQQRALGDWWDGADEQDRRAAAIRAGFAGPDGRSDRQTTAYTSRNWAALAPAVQKRIIAANPEVYPELGGGIAPVELPPPSRTTVAEPPEEAVPEEPVPEPTVAVQTKPIRSVASTLTGISVPVRYEVVDADSLIASLDAEGRTNKQYPKELQPRERDRLASAAQIEDIKNNLRPDWLDQSPKASDGAPIIAPDGVVESGNGRVVALQKAYQEGKTDEYVQYLKDRGYNTEGIAKPVLVRVRENDMTQEERIAFTQDANEPDQLAMSATEQAIADSGRIPDDMLDLYRGGIIGSEGNRPFVRSFMEKVVPVAARGRMISGDGGLSQEAVRRIEGALFHKAYGDSELLKTLVESTDNDIKAIGGTLREMAAPWAKMRAAAADGRIHPSMDQTDKLIEAANLVRRARHEGREVAEFVGQKDIFSGQELNPTSEAFLRLMFRNTSDWTNPTGVAALKNSLMDYVNEANKTTPGQDLLGAEARSPENILSEAKAKQKTPVQQGLFSGQQKQQPAAPSVEPSVQEAGRAGVEPEPKAAKVERAQPATEPRPEAKEQAEPEPKRKYPEGVVVKKDGTPFSKPSSAMLQANNFAKKDGGTYEAVEVEGGWGYRRAGKARKQVKEKVEKVSPAKPTKVEKAATATRERKTKKEFEGKRKEINDALRKGLDERGLTDVELNTPDSISDIEGKKAIDDSTMAVGRSRGNVIEVALAGEHNHWQVMSHETVHVMRRLGLFKEPEWRVLQNHAKADKSLMADIQGRYADEHLTEDAIVEEVIAEQYGDWSAGVNQPTGFLATIYDKIRSFLEALRNALRGNGFRSASDIWEGVETGEVGARPREPRSEVERSERYADQAIKDFDSPTAGIMSEVKYAKVRRHDEFFVRDMGLFKQFFVTPRTVAAFSRSFARVYNVAKKQFATRDMTIADLGKTYEPYRNLDMDRKAKVNKVLEIGRLDQRVYRTAPNGTISVTATRDTGLMKAGETVTLDADEVVAYRSVRAMLDKALDTFRDQTITDFGLDPAVVQTPQDVLALITPGMRSGQVGKLRTLAKMINDIDQSKRTGYVPFSRFGNVVVVAETVDPVTGKSTTVHSESFEVRGLQGRLKKFRAGRAIANVPEIGALKAELRRRYPNARIRHFEVGSKEDTRHSMERDNLVELTQLHGQALEDAVQRMHKEALSKGFRRHFLASKNIPGYSIDLERSVADYVITFSGFKARREHHKAWEAAMRLIPENKPKEQKYADNYRQYVNNPVEEYAMTRQAGFVMLLAGNVSNAAANMTQVPLVAGPYMSLFANPARVELELARAYKDVAGMFGGNWREIFNPDKAPMDVRAALKQAWDEGEFTPLAMHDIMGVAYNTKASSRKISAALKATVDVMAWPQTSTERANRLVTFIASYRLAKSDPRFQKRASVVLKDHQLAREILINNFSPENFAKFMVDETQYDVGKINRAKLLRGPGAAIGQFKPFVMQTIELHYKTFVLHKGGAKAWAMMMAALIGSAGLWALPGSEDAAWLYELIYKKWTGVDVDIKANLRGKLAEFTKSPFVAEMMTNGPMRYLGIDMTNRIGLGKIVPRTMEEAGGVPLSLYAGRTIAGISHLKEGRGLEAMMEVMPLAARNLIQPWLWKSDGVRTRRGDPVMGPEEISGLDVAVKSAGFNPRTVAERREMEWAQQRAGKATQEYKAKLYRRIARTMIDMSKAANTGNVEEKDEAIGKYRDTMTEIQEWNDKVIKRKEFHLVIVINEVALKRKIQEEVVGRGRVRESKAPKVTRPRQQEIREIYGQ